ncbi:DMT family transporter [Pelagibius litoralis]|uniref:DMT family transporter n=1 Tax=Pelagibius litoralis TaxID=374515 RepID=A0A967C726_9PROT|nr:DMT family transporter [Pelagibius litoralis]
MSERQLALALLLIAPALFCSNMLTARATHDLFPPIALAFWRWFATLLLLMPFIAAALWQHRSAIRREWRDLLILGALGMGVCGAFVYIGADTTTATNIGLIYAASPILIVLIARFAYQETVSPLQSLGIALSLTGVVAIICRGDFGVLAGLSFAAGDLWVVCAMIAWAIYSIMLRHRPSAMPLMVRFAAIVGGGVLILLPFTIAEGVSGDLPPLNTTSFLTVGFLALFASFGAYQAYGLIQRTLGAGPTGLLMYLIPLYNAVLAFLVLGEDLQLYHLVGAAMVLPGIYLATRKAAA